MLKRRNAKGSVSFIASMIVVTIWSAANALEMSSITFSTKLFWANVQYFSYCYSPVTLLALCMEFTGYDHLVHNKKFLWIAVIPSIIFILVWTDGFHGLIRYDMHMDYNGFFPVISKKYGPLFIIHAVYSETLNLSAWALLVKAFFSRKTVYRKQAFSLLIALSLIIFPNILYVLNLGIVKRYDLTPLFFGPAGLIAALGIFRYKLFEVLPIAWTTVIKTMNAGVMVLDLEGRILDINPYFEKIIGTDVKSAVTKPVQDVCSKIPELLDGCLSHEDIRREFSYDNKAYEVMLSQLRDNKGKKIGRLALTYDITQKKKEQQDYLSQQWKIAIKTERERNAKNLHDNLGQILGFINLQAQGIKQELENEGVNIVSDKLDKLVDVSQSANSDIREYISSTINETETDFISSLKQYILRFKRQTGINLELEMSNEFTWVRLSLNIRLNILNIIKEALNNIRKHSAAENAKIKISVSDRSLVITIADDGKGFNQNFSGEKAGFGLGIMQERAEEIGAHFSIESTAGTGSRIYLEVPIGEAESNENNAG